MTYALEVTIDDLRLIAAGLNELPVKTGAAALLVKLQQQVTALEQAAESPNRSTPPDEPLPTPPRRPRAV